MSLSKIHSRIRIIDNIRYLLINTAINRERVNRAPMLGIKHRLMFSTMFIRELGSAAGESIYTARLAGGGTSYEVRSLEPGPC